MLQFSLKWVKIFKPCPQFKILVPFRVFFFCFWFILSSSLCFLVYCYFHPCPHLYIAGFHCHTTIKTNQQLKSRIKEEKEDEYSNSVANIQVYVMFRAGDIRRNVLLKFLRLWMETPCLCPSQGHKYGDRKLTKTYVIGFSIKSL